MVLIREVRCGVMVRGEADSPTTDEPGSRYAWSVPYASRRGNGVENQAGSDENYEFRSWLAGVNPPVGKHWLAWTASFETANVRPIHIMPNTTGHWHALQPPSLLAALLSNSRPAPNIPRHRDRLPSLPTRVNECCRSQIIKRLLFPPSSSLQPRPRRSVCRLATNAYPL